MAKGADGVAAPDDDVGAVPPWVGAAVGCAVAAGAEGPWAAGCVARAVGVAAGEGVGSGFAVPTMSTFREGT